MALYYFIKAVICLLLRHVAHQRKFGCRSFFALASLCTRLMHNEAFFTDAQWSAAQAGIACHQRGLHLFSSLLVKTKQRRNRTGFQIKILQLMKAQASSIIKQNMHQDSVRTGWWEDDVSKRKVLNWRMGSSDKGARSFKASRTFRGHVQSRRRWLTSREFKTGPRAWAEVRKRTALSLLVLWCAQPLQQAPLRAAHTAAVLG